MLLHLSFRSTSLTLCTLIFLILFFLFGLPNSLLTLHHWLVMASSSLLPTTLHQDYSCKISHQIILPSYSFTLHYNSLTINKTTFNRLTTKKNSRLLRPSKSEVAVWIIWFECWVSSQNPIDFSLKLSWNSINLSFDYSMIIDSQFSTFLCGVIVEVIECYSLRRIT